MKHNSLTSNYTLVFSDIQENNGFVNFIDEASGNEEIIGISIDDRAFQYRVQSEFPSIVADIIDIAVAIHATDRLTQQPLDEEQTRIQVVLPVRNLNVLCKSKVTESLSRLLYWATGSEWMFEFRKKMEAGRMVERQSLLLSSAPHVDEVALWSGGLDALAGLCNRLQDYSDKQFMLFGTGSNDSVYRRQKEVFDLVQLKFPNHLSLCRVPLRFFDSKTHEKNKFSRARGVVFTLLGSACAYLAGHRTLYLYENGVGAINLPYRKSSVGLDHSRSVHPLTLLQVGNVVSGIIEEDFEVRNPFLFSTKGEMCRAIPYERESSLIQMTTSCDSPHRKVPTQCGYCSSCLLRRQSLAVAGIKDPSRYVVPHGEPPAGDIKLHLRHMLAQASIIRNLLSGEKNSILKWQALTQRFPELDDISDRSASNQITAFDIREELLRLYQNYVSEWAAVEPQLLFDMLDSSNEQRLPNELLVSHQ